MLTQAQALELLHRMQAAAPPTTAAKLREVAALLQSSPQAAPQDAANDTPLSDTDVLLLQLDEAMRPVLNTLKILTGGMSAEKFGALNSEQAEQMEIIEAQVCVALALMDGIQQMIALRRGLLEITPLVFSATLLLHEAEREAHADAMAREQQLVVELPPTDLQAIGDYPRIRTILFDLVDNAIRYSPLGGTIRLSVENLGTHLLFSVSDEGIGLTDADMAHVGEPFWRGVHQQLVRNHTGTGLRLYLAREILALQSGELIFSGEPGVGSTFSFTLPVVM